MRNRICSIFVVFCLISFDLFAKQISVKKNTDIVKNVSLKNDFSNKELTLMDILDIALKNNPQVRQSWINIDVGNRVYKTQLSEVFPTINGELSYSNSRTKYDEGSSSLRSKGFTPAITMDYLLFNFGGRTADIMNFKYKLNSIKFETNNFIQNFVYDVIEAYYNLFSTLANEKAAKETENSSYEAFKAASVRYDIGLVPLTDKLQAETSYTQSRLVRERAENTVKIKRAELNYLLNLSPIIEIKLAVPMLDVSKDDFQENIVNLIEKALNNRPDLKAYYESKKAKKAEIYSATTDWLPSVSLNGSYSHTNDMKRGGRDDRDNYNIGIMARMPFFTGGYIYNNVAKVKSELSIINEQIKDLEKNIELDVWTAYQNFMTAKRTYITSQTLLKSALETEKTMLGRYKNGKSSILDLLDAQSSLATARYELINAQHNWFVSRANLIRSLGEISPEELENLTNPVGINNIVSNNQNNSNENN